MARKEEGFDVAVGFSRFFMRLHGIWPGDTSSKFTWARFAFVPPAVIILMFINIPQTVQIFFVGGDLNAILDILTLANVPLGIALAKILGVSYNHNILRQLIVSVSGDWKHTTKKSELQVMWRNARISRTFSILFIGLAEVTVLANTARMFYILYSTRSEAESSGIKNYKKPLYYTGKFPYDAQSSPNFEITWVMQILATILAAGSFMAVDALFVTLVLHLCAQLTNLQTAFRKIGEDKHEKEVDFMSKLSKLMKRHRKINEFADIIEYSFNMMFLFQVMSSTFLLCLQGYLFVILISSQKVILVELIFMVYFIICSSCSIFVYCYVAEILREESLQLGNAIFYSKWYNLPANKARLLIIAILRVQKPLELSAGKFCIFSLNLFCNIVKTSAGYISVLLAVRDKIVQP
ncbi:odorant receptor 20 [Nasonia vitripennis]|uniref:Odorant receptor n=1 Tax=Nasonia vitripennis TaxID=7425 RepID=A0A7M6UML8_NASVI|nr:odorant receptor 20 [Nasonia vitripennis]